MLLTAEQAREQVKAGEKLMDERGPDNWRSRVNRATLRMQNMRECLLGQVYGSFDDGLEALGLTSQQSISYGFYTDVEDCAGADACYCISSYMPLTIAWLEILPALSLQDSPATIVS